MSHTDILQGPLRPELIRDEILADLFEASARRAPDQIALIHGERSLSYAELDALADRAASRLIEAGVRPGQIVGLWLPRGIDLLVMQLAIAKTGAAWLPTDADTPVDRVAVCLDDAAAPGLVTCEAFVPQLAAIGRSVWTAEALLADTGAPLRRREGARPDQPAYVIYTSGSTGKPKGIAINQGSICHFLRSENAVLGIRADDKVYQGFSVAFDMSFEEIWISYLVGATLWIAPKEIAADPDVLPQALAENGITALHAVPTLLALFAQDVPHLRLINLGGEMCPEALVAKWARPGRQVFNTYGPTEATVSASLAELQAGEPVTIGTPLPNYGLLVIAADVENGLRLLPRGETGELCITGPGVAAGYLGRPELTAEKFLANPWATGDTDRRMYRTGDLARIDADGRVQCLGRADDQIKIRGFRVELGEIEAVLAQQAGVGTVAVLLRNDDGIDQLVAFIVPEGDAPLQPGALRAALAERLPPYMVPGRYEAMTEMPRLTSGKIDRKALKALPLTPLASAEGSDVAETDAERVLFAALEKLFPGQPIRRDADFFSDLGGHSLFAARLASALRADPRFAGMTVRDIYLHRRIGHIAGVLESMQTAAPATAIAWTPPSAWRRWRCGVAQAAAVPGLVAIRMAQWLAPFFTYHFFTGDPGDSIPFAVAMSVLVFLLATLGEFVLAFAGKWLIAGRLKPGRYPLWGLTYYRWWLADRLVEAAPAYLLSGSSLYAWWLRALGARIGRDVQIGSMTLRAPELLTVHDYASIGNAVNFENARVVRGELLLGPIEVGAHGYVGSYSVLEGNTRVAEWGHLEGQSALADGVHVPAHRRWSGSPARDVGEVDPAALAPRPPVSRLRSASEGLFFVAGALLVATLFFMPVFPTFIMIDWLDEIDGLAWGQSDVVMLQLLEYFLLALPASAVLVVATALISAGIRWSVLPRLKTGSWPVHSNVYCGKWLVNQIQENSLQILHGVYATVYAPFWYRLLGAKVGRDAEISTALGVVPDMLTLGDETFIADAVLLGDEEINGGWMTMQPTVVERRSFVGNGAYVPDGTTIPENVLIGVLSRIPDATVMQSGDTWLGSPSINLPARETTSGYPESLTFHPSPLRRIGRGLIEAFRIVSPHAIVIAVGYAIVLDVMPAAGAGNWGEVAWDLTEAGLLFGLATFIFVALFKWLLLGRYKTRAVPMWTPFVWLSEAATNMYEGIAVPNFLRYLRGTPWLPVAMNLLGARIGRGVYLDTTDITEFDCVHIGDYSELNALTCPQTHLFEDRVMKVDHVRIGARVNIGPRTTVLYSATVGDDARLGPLTLVMKGENIPPASPWAGCPAAPSQG
ncbi:non-ribosomal peptide synthetase [Niveibacterium umoris]|uniref:Non-ribosomal peptide synthetase-like protein n=1 Tax=Niveibacterium umoris TaxID=1193620 RepID=A0A840BLT9_9RHOO|nr:Pls/PosA family non-ribosomal peptide synthetase [Niveibacterium umoris]MBB4013434.1 non-ribosomal peptide synthetase-like protein [Niveibacterium umoris]